MLKQITPALILATYSQKAWATSPLEAAQSLASSGETDPQGFTLMIAAISLLFVFALTLIIATSLHLFKKKPSRR